ncbi:MAG: hypothetical protein LBJ67_05965 [Planctomycetaceae bacterium]|jgi:hypothetical protein|nr:hypothetical protein [Planctomycetaceae bacterium]
MISIFFLFANFLAMGLGVWLAIRQKEQLRVVKTFDMKADNPQPMTAKTSTLETAASLMPEYQSESQTMETWRPQPKESHENFEGSLEITTQNNSEIFAQHPSGIFDLSDFMGNSVVSQPPATEFAEKEPDETLGVEPVEKNIPNESDVVSGFETSPFSTSTTTIENIVEMIQKLDVSGKFSGIASQLQEIHDLMATPDEKYYVSEDAEFFITPKESPFVSTMFCRPVVGGKK